MFAGRFSCRRTLRMAVPVIACLGASVGPALAAALNWNNAAGGAASTSSNWNPNQIPGGADDLTFAMAGAYSVTFNASTTASRTQTYRQGNVTLTMASPHTTSNGAAIGDLAGDVATVTLTTGSWSSGTAGFVNIGDASNSTGTLNVNDDDADFFVTGTSDLFVGNNGTGTLNVTGGGSVTLADALHVGQGSAATGNLTVSGFVVQAPFPISSLQVNGTGQSRWGNGGDANVTVSNGALAHFVGDLVMANLSTSLATATVQGPGLVVGATLDVDGDLLLGRNTSAGTAAGTATLNANADGRVLTGGTLFVGGDPDGGTATLNINSGSIVQATSVAKGTGGTINHTGGTLKIDGGTYTGTAVPLSVAGLAANDVTLIWANNAGQTLVPAGGVSLIVGDDLGVGSFEGFLRVESGADLDVGSGDLNLGDDAGTTGDVTVTGAGSRLIANSVNSDVRVGFNGSGEVQVESGGQLLCRNLLVPALNDADGFVNCADDNSSVTTQFLAVGHSSGAGQGLVQVQLDATISVTDPGFSTNIRSTGSLVVAASGTLTTPGTISVESGGELAVGGTVTNAALVDVDGGTLDSRANSSGTPLVDARVRLGAGGVLDANSEDITVGDATSNSGFVGDIGSTIEIGAHTLTLLDADEADVDAVVIAGGTLAAPNGIEIVNNGTIDGTGTIDGDVFFNSGGGVITATGAAGITFTGLLRNNSGTIDGTKFTFTGIGGGWTGAGAINAKAQFDSGTEINALANMTIGDGSTTGATLNCVTHLNTNHNLTFNDSNGLGLGTLTDMNGGDLISTNGLVVNNGRVLRGRGDVDVFNGSLSIFGTIDPAQDDNADEVYDGLGVFDVAGAYSQGANSHFFCDIAGYDNEFRALVDVIDVSGAATLNGTLHLDIINGYVPQLGDLFTIMRFASRTGTFSTVDAICLRPLGLKFDVIYNATNVLVAVVPDSPIGDMNCDCSVDFFDIDPFLLALFDPAAYELAFPNCDINNADVNGNGSIDFFDIDPFVAVLFG